MDTLKVKLRKRGLSTAGKKAKLLDKLKNAMITRILLIAETICSVTSNNFDQRFRRRVLFSSEVVQKPENEEPMFLDPSQTINIRERSRVLEIMMWRRPLASFQWPTKLF